MSDSKNRKLSANPQALDVLAKSIKQGLTDKEIQSKLVQECGYKWTLNTISRRRRAMGVVKKPGEKTDLTAVDTPSFSDPPHGMSDTEKARWFTNEFKKTHLFKTIQKQFTGQEVEVYLNDFGLLCCQFEDIVISEFMQIDDFLKHRILIDRQLILCKSLQQEISDLQDWLLMNPRMEDESKEKAKLRLLQQRHLDDKYRQLKAVNDRYDALVKERQKIQGALAATRKDRLDELRGGKETFFDLVAKLQHSRDERDRQGRFAELTKIAAEDVKREFRKSLEFPDGSEEPIIMDSETIFEDSIDE